MVGILNFDPIFPLAGDALMGSYLTRLTFFVALLAGLVVQIQALSPEYLACQLQKDAETSPLTGCPAGTLYVSPTDSRATFTSVQAAIESLWVTVGIFLSSVLIFLQATDGRRCNSDWRRRIL